MEEDRPQLAHIQDAGLVDRGEESGVRGAGGEGRSDREAGQGGHELDEQGAHVRGGAPGDKNQTEESDLIKGKGDEVEPIYEGKALSSMGFCAIFKGTPGEKAGIVVGIIEFLGYVQLTQIPFSSYIYSGIAVSENGGHRIGKRYREARTPARVKELNSISFFIILNRGPCSNAKGISSPTPKERNRAAIPRVIEFED